MTILLPPELANLIQQWVDNGAYPNPAEVVREGLRLLQEQEEQKLEALRQALAVGREQIRQGKCGPLNAWKILDRVREQEAAERDESVSTAEALDDNLEALRREIAIGIEQEEHGEVAPLYVWDTLERVRKRRSQQDANS